MASQIVYPYHVALLAIISLLVICALSLVSFTRGSWDIVTLNEPNKPREFSGEVEIGTTLYGEILIVTDSFWLLANQLRSRLILEKYSKGKEKAQRVRQGLVPSAQTTTIDLFPIKKRKLKSYGKWLTNKEEPTEKGHSKGNQRRTWNLVLFKSYHSKKKKTYFSEKLWRLLNDHTGQIIIILKVYCNYQRSLVHYLKSGPISFVLIFKYFFV